MTILAIFLLAIASAVLGRMGGAKGYDTKFRDIGCSAIVVIVVWLLFGYEPSTWWVYALIFGLHWGAFSTYWDKVFGYDNLSFSGAMVGLALSPILFIDVGLILFVGLRSVFLFCAWGALNKWRRPKVLFWKGDVFEELARYFVAL